MWLRVLGAHRDPGRIALLDWERFVDERASGALDPRGRPVAQSVRHPVGPRRVEADLLWLRWVFNWATRWKTETGRYLLDENPVRGYPVPKERNPRRPVSTKGRFAALRAVSDEVEMHVRWFGRLRTRRSYLTELLEIARGSGRRISAICRLRRDDLELDPGEARPYGSIRWRSEHDKAGVESVVPVTRSVRLTLERHLSDYPAGGRRGGPLFPKPSNLHESITRFLARAWLRRAESMAGLERLDGGLWHPFRREWATARKDLPVQDVARAGGWRSVVTVQRIYQQADAETVLRVVTWGE